MSVGCFSCYPTLTILNAFLKLKVNVNILVTLRIYMLRLETNQLTSTGSLHFYNFIIRIKLC